MSSDYWGSNSSEDQELVRSSDDSQISLPHDVMVEVFGHFEVEELVHSLALVCRGWFALSRRETLWAHFCHERDVERLPPLITSWRRYFRLEVNRRWDPTLFTFRDELSYRDHGREVFKARRSPDTSIALLNSRLRPGQRIYVTMRIVSMGDAFLGGVTACPLLTKHSMGWGHLRLPGSWGMWDRRVGIQLNGTSFIGPDLKVGAIVGIYVDLVEHRVQFSVDGARVVGVGHEAHPLQFTVREKIQRLREILTGELNYFDEFAYSWNEAVNIVEKDPERALGRANWEALRREVEVEIARLQGILDSDPLGNPSDPNEEWAIYALLDWAEDLVRIEEVYRGALAEKVFNALPEGFTSTIEPPDNDED